MPVERSRDDTAGDMTAPALAALRRLEDAIGVVLFTAMLVVVLLQVFVRFALYRWIQIAWADEAGRALLVWSSFWGAALVTRESRHITVDLVYERLPLAGQWVLRIGGDLVMGAFLLLVMWKGLPMFLESFSRPSPATNLPAFIFDGALWVSGALMIVHVAANAFSRWRYQAEPDVHPPVIGSST